MKINRNAQMSRRFKDGQKAGIVNKQAAGCAIQHDANKSVARDATFEFSGSRSWIFQGQRCEACEAGWMSARCLGQLVVDVSRQRGCDGGIKLIKPKCGQGEHLEIDAALIHRCDAPCAEVEEFRLHLRKLRRKAVTVIFSGAQKRFGNKMFFERYGAHFVCLFHSASSTRDITTSAMVSPHHKPRTPIPS